MTTAALRASKVPAGYAGVRPGSNIDTMDGDTSNRESKSSMSKRSSLALGLLALLIEAPMHPYRMQTLIKQRGKDRVINVGQLASLYRTIERLRRDGLVRVRETERQSLHPERTIYEVTDAGRIAAKKWMREILPAPRAEFPEFPVGIAYLPLLDHADVIDQLEKRRSFLSRKLADHNAKLGECDKTISRLFLLEEEYLREMTSTELRWVDSLIDDLRACRIYWDDEWIQAVIKEEVSQEGS